MKRKCPSDNCSTTGLELGTFAERSAKDACQAPIPAILISGNPSPISS